MGSVCFYRGAIVEKVTALLWMGEVFTNQVTMKKIAIVGSTSMLGKSVTNAFVQALNNYLEKFDPEKTWQELGKPQTRFVDYIHRG